MEGDDIIKSNNTTIAMKANLVPTLITRLAWEAVSLLHEILGHLGGIGAIIIVAS